MNQSSQKYCVCEYLSQVSDGTHIRLRGGELVSLSYGSSVDLDYPLSFLELRSIMSFHNLKRRLNISIDN